MATPVKIHAVTMISHDRLSFRSVVAAAMAMG